MGSSGSRFRKGEFCVVQDGEPPNPVLTTGRFRSADFALKFESTFGHSEAADGAKRITSGCRPYGEYGIPPSSAECCRILKDKQMSGSWLERSDPNLPLRAVTPAVYMLGRRLLHHLKTLV